MIQRMLFVIIVVISRSFGTVLFDIVIFLQLKTEKENFFFQTLLQHCRPPSLWKLKDLYHRTLLNILLHFHEFYVGSFSMQLVKAGGKTDQFLVLWYINSVLHSENVR